MSQTKISFRLGEAEAMRVSAMLENLFEDERFTKLLPRRDQALNLSDGHLLETLDAVIALNTDSDYARALGNFRTQ